MTSQAADCDRVANNWVGSVCVPTVLGPRRLLTRTVPSNLAYDPQIGAAIGHWIAVYGYSGSGATSYFADPATYWSGVQPKFSYGTNSFVNTFVQANGITW
ncbi:hypothetical protein GCM10023146_01620 [Nocardioides caricicola]